MNTMANNGQLSWADVFPFNQPYEHQREGITTAIDTARGGGYTIVEGACGTGKTLLSLTAGISLIRDPSTKFERVVAITNVKQQQQAFLDDLKIINEKARNEGSRIDPVSGLTLVGKGDVCSYRAGASWSYDDVYEYCSGLRERTRELIEAKDSGEYRSAQMLTSEAESSSNSQLSIGSTQSPYPEDPAIHDGKSYCPFYAQSQADSAAGDQQVTISDTVLTPDELVNEATQAGACPHSSMRSLIDDIEVVVGNYQHVFSPLTVKLFSHPLIDDSTFLIIDESHGLVTDLRDQFSYSINDWELSKAIDELDHIREWTRTGTTEGDLIEQLCRSGGFDPEYIDILYEFCSDLRDFVDDLIATRPPGEFTDTHPKRTSLRSPDVPEPDELTVWANEYYPEVFESAYELGTALEIAVGKVRKKVDRMEFEPEHIEDVTRVLTRWNQLGHTTYYRDLEVEVGSRGSMPTKGDSWELWIRNCLPTARLSNRLNDLGGGIIMSATLQPMDMYADLLGVNFLDVPTETQTYPLSFPESNRGSYAVDLPPFTYDNRGSVPDGVTNNSAGTDVRSQYAAAITEFCQTVPGNVLIATPSYSEANWVSTVLENSGINKDVYTDGSSSRSETNELREQFFSSDDSVLTTSLRGTLTEGVDYRGDRLHSVGVVGVPMLNPTTPRNKARLTAYEDEFGGAAFQYGFTIPAVWKVRQALGRVIRSEADVGVRVLFDGRYDPNSGSAVASVLPDALVEELTVGGVSEVMPQIERQFQNWL